MLPSSRTPDSAARTPAACRPNATWSPGSLEEGGGPQMLALKRAQNWLSSVLVPLSNLGQKSPTADPLYATQIAFLKDQTGVHASMWWC